MSECGIKTLRHCPSCKNFRDYGYEEYLGERVEVTTCELGRYREHMQAEKNRGLCECDYWEAK